MNPGAPGWPPRQMAPFPYPFQQQVAGGAVAGAPPMYNPQQGGFPGVGLVPGVPGVVPGGVPSGVPGMPFLTPMGGIPLASTIIPNEEIEDRKNLVEMQHDAHYNMNAMLAQNILASDYFKSLYELKTHQEVVDEIYDNVDHLEPFALGKTRLPSTGFSLLYKLFIMRVTHKQLKGLITYKKAPYIRGIGFLFIRFVVPPEKMWDWFEPYLDDPEKFTPGGDRVEITMGQFIRQLLDNIKYFDTILRRIPVKLDREFKKKVIMHDMKARSKTDNESETGELEVGTKCKAKYTDGKFYDVEINEITKDNKYIFTWMDYGTQDELDLEDFQTADGRKFKALGSSKNKRSSSRRRGGSSRSRSGSRGRSSRSRKSSRNRSSDRGSGKKSSKRRSSSRSRSPKRSESKRDKSRSPSKSEADIEQMILRQGRAAAAAQGTDYARKPVGYKKALTLQLTTSSRRRSRSRSRSRDRDPPDRDYQDRPRSRASHRNRDRAPSNSNRGRSISPPRKKEMTAAQKLKMSNLKEIYGDASGKNNKKDGPSRPGGGVDDEAVLRLGF